jgi:antitoxin (DNA-binding transcriptional repressor) of toxin-antitoxin stability system
MKTVSAHQANHDFSELLSRVERGEEILITKRSKPVAPRLTAERQAAINHAIEVMAQGPPWGAALRTFTRDEMHEFAVADCDPFCLIKSLSSPSPVFDEDISCRRPARRCRRRSLPKAIWLCANNLSSDSFTTSCADPPHYRTKWPPV